MQFFLRKRDQVPERQKVSISRDNIPDITFYNINILTVICDCSKNSVVLSLFQVIAPAIIVSELIQIIWSSLSTDHPDLYLLQPMFSGSPF
jgi:hypothetical protein